MYIICNLIALRKIIVALPLVHCLKAYRFPCQSRLCMKYSYYYLKILFRFLKNVIGRINFELKVDVWVL